MSADLAETLRLIVLVLVWCAAGAILGWRAHQIHVRPRAGDAPRGDAHGRFIRRTP